MTRCLGKTLGGKQCSRVIKTGSYCHQHQYKSPKLREIVKEFRQFRAARKEMIAMESPASIYNIQRAEDNRYASDYMKSDKIYVRKRSSSTRHIRKSIAACSLVAGVTLLCSNI